MAKVISLINEKGGVGKTTSTNLIAASLKNKNYKVLCIDFDPQGHLSFSFGADNREKPTIYDVIKHNVKARFAIQETAVTDIIPANDILKSMESEFTSAGNESLLKSVMKQLTPFYDYILIDSPPELGIISANALVASDIVLIPSMPDGYGLMGVIKVHETVLRIKNAFNPNLTIGGVILVRYYARETLSRSVSEVLVELTKTLNIPILDGKIRHSNVISNATTVRQVDAVAEYPFNKAIQDYKNLVSELLRKGVL